MTEIDNIGIERKGSVWVLRVTYTVDGYVERHRIGDPGQFLDETQRTLGPWIAEDRLIQAMYAIPPEPQSIRANLDPDLARDIERGK